MNINSNSTALDNLLKAPIKVHAKQDDALQTLLPLEEFPHTTLIGQKKEDGYDIDFYAVPRGVKVISYDENTGKKVWADAKGWSVHRGKEIEVVTLHNNKTIITDDDPRAIYGIAKDAPTLTPERFTPSEALKRQVCVPQLLTSEDDVAPTHNTCPACYFDWTLGELFKADIPKDGAHLISDVDFEFGQFLGVFAGDGWWDKEDYREQGSRFHDWANAERFIHVADNEGDNARFVEAYLTKLTRKEGDTAPFKVTTHVFSAEKYNDRYGDTVRYTYCGAALSPIAQCLSLLLDGHRDEQTSGSANKKMPSWLIGAPIAARFGFLCGMLSTDGSISIHKHKENTKRKPQLLVAITSTSIFLIRDLQALCQSIGIPATITFSKMTKAENSSWILNLSTPYVKVNENKMIGMANKRKLAVLQAAEVIEASQSKSHVHVLLTDAVADIILKWTVTGSKFAKNIQPVPGMENLAERRRSIYNELSKRKKEGYMTPKFAQSIIQHAHYDLTFRTTRLSQLQQEASKLYANTDPKCPVDQAQHDLIRACLEDLFPKPLLAHPYAKMRQQLRAKINEAKFRGYYTLTDRNLLYKFAQSMTVDKGLLGEPLFNEWVEKIVNGSFSWAKVVDVVKTGKVESLNDLTVPGYETFVNADGVVLSNTINLHVPASDEAVKEAYEKLMPSSDPFSDRDTDKVVLLPKQEQILGNYTAATSPNTATYDFDTEEEALKAIKQGQIPLSANVQIRGGVKMASQKENEEVMQVKGPVRDPKTGKWMPTKNKNETDVQPDVAPVEKKASANPEQQLKAILATQFGVDPNAIIPTTHLRNDLNADSLDEIEILQNMEDTFNNGTPYEDVNVTKLKTYADLLNLIQANAAAQVEKTAAKRHWFDLWKSWDVTKRREVMKATLGEERIYNINFNAETPEELGPMARPVGSAMMMYRSALER